ncbi:TEL2-interacting protein 1 [Dinochytrium kinnereticum]|nr:TEL2-interacting protein 1 [Dinochytrium kinnereticum]
MPYLCSRSPNQAKPLCLELTDSAWWPTPRKPDDDPILRLRKFIKAVVDENSHNHSFRTQLLSKFSEYVCLPLFLILQSPSAHPVVVEKAVNMLDYYFKSAGGGFKLPSSVFLEGVRILPMVIAHGRATTDVIRQKVENPNEDLKLLGISCLDVLVTKYDEIDCFDSNTFEEIDDERGFKVMLSYDWRGHEGDDDIDEKRQALLTADGVKGRGKLYVAHLIGILLEVAELEKNSRLRSAALQTVADWCNFLGERIILMQFLPGIVSSLTKLLGRSLGSMGGVSVEGGRLHSAIVVRGYRLLTTIICRCFASSNESSISYAFDSPRESLLKLGKKGSLDDGPETRRSQKIDEDNIEKVLSALRIMFRQCSHPSWRARVSIMRAAFDIAVSCAIPLPSGDEAQLSRFLPELLNSIVFCLDDPLPAIREECKICLRTISSRIANSPSSHASSQNSSLTKLSRYLIDSFETVLLDFASSIMDDIGLNEQQKVGVMQKAIGYMLVIGLEGVRQTIYAVFGKFAAVLMRSLKKMRKDFVYVLGSNSHEIEYVRDQKVSEIILERSAPGEVRSRAPLQPVEESSGDFLEARTYISFRSEIVTRGIKRVLRCLALMGDTAFMFDHLLDYLRRAESLDDNREEAESAEAIDFFFEAAFCLNEFCCALSFKGCDPFGSAVNNDDPVVEVPKAIDHSRRSALIALAQSYCLADVNHAWIPSPNSKQIVSKAGNTSPNDNGGNALLGQYLVIEGIGLVALALAADFSPLLIDTLYLIMEKAGSHHEVVRSAAVRALRIIAYCCGYNANNSSEDLSASTPTPPDTVEAKALTSLVCANIDYLVNEITYRLHYLRENSASPQMLVACLHFGGTSILPFFSDALLEVSQSLDEYRSESSLVFELVRVFDELTNVILLASDKELGPPQNPDAPELRRLLRGEAASSSNMDENDIQNQDVLRFFERRAEEDIDEEPWPAEGISSLKPFSEREPIATKDEMENALQEEPEEETKGEPSSSEDELTIPQKLFLEPALGIISKAQYLLYIDHPQIRSLVLRVISKSVKAFRDRFPSRLNPIIHRLWPIILNRLADPEPFVVLEALNLTRAIVSGGKDFMSKRLSSDLIPKCLNILREVGKEFKRNFRPAFKKSLWKQNLGANILSEGGPPFTFGNSFYVAFFEVLKVSVQSGSLPRRDLRNLNDLLWPLLQDTPPPASTSFLAKDSKLMKLVQDLARGILLDIGRTDPNIVWASSVAAKGIAVLSPNFCKPSVDCDDIFTELPSLTIPAFVQNELEMSKLALLDNEHFFLKIDSLVRGAMLS